MSNGGFIGLTKSYDPSIGAVTTPVLLGELSSSNNSNDSFISDFSPLNLQVGDLLVGISSFAESGTAIAPSFPASWTDLGSVTALDSYDTGIRIAYKFMTDTVDTGVTTTSDVLTNEGTTIHVYAFRYAGTPISQGTQTALNTGIIDPSAATIVNNNSILLVAASLATNSGSFSPLVGGDLSDISYEANGVSYRTSVGVGLRYPLPAGVYNPDSWGITGGANSTGFCVASVRAEIPPQGVVSVSPSTGIWTLEDDFNSKL